MSDLSGYRDDMHEHELTDQAVDRILSGAGAGIDDELAVTVEAIRTSGRVAPDPTTAASHVARAAEIAASVPQPLHTGGHTMKPGVLATAARAAAAAAVILVVSAGAAYAGVLPDSVETTVTNLASSVGLGDLTTDESGDVADDAPDEADDGTTTAADEVVDDEDGKTGEGDEADDATTDETKPEAKDREPPAEYLEAAVVIESIGAYRAAAREWKDCVLGGHDGAQMDAAGAAADAEVVDPATCGAPPLPTDFGITDEVLAGLPEKLQAKAVRFVAPIATKLACIEANLDAGREAIRDCIQSSLPDDAHRGDRLRDRDGKDGDGLKDRDHKGSDRDGDRSDRDRSDRDGADRDVSHRDHDGDRHDGRSDGDRNHTGGRSGSSTRGGDGR
jgi:hypothetical protein